MAKVLADAWRCWPTRARACTRRTSFRDVDGAALGVVHRDASRGDIILTDDGAPEVVDFGLAAASREDDASVPRRRSAP